MPEQLRCADCGVKGTKQTLKESLKLAGKWFCKNRGDCEERIQEKEKRQRNN